MISQRAGLRRLAARRRYRRELSARPARARSASGDLAIAVVYICPTDGDPEHRAAAERFASTYRAFPPLAAHTLHVVFNGDTLTGQDAAPFAGIPFEAHQHDNTGWDIGAFQMAAREIGCDMIVCLGANSYFKRAGWLRRMGDAFRERGDALYGASGSYECSPHIRTTGFWCNPELIRAYPKRVITYEDRYEFEHGSTSITALAKDLGLGCWVVTWDGVYGESEWRAPDDIFRRGDQSNSLLYDRHFDLYDAMDSEARRVHAALADGEPGRRPEGYENP